MSRSTSSCTMCHTRSPTGRQARRQGVEQAQEGRRCYAGVLASIISSHACECALLPRSDPAQTAQPYACIWEPCTHLLAQKTHTLQIRQAARTCSARSPCDFQFRVVSTSRGASISSCLLSCMERSCRRYQQPVYITAGRHSSDSQESGGTKLQHASSQHAAALLSKEGRCTASLKAMRRLLLCGRDTCAVPPDPRQY